MSTQTPKVEESSKFNLLTSIWIVPFVALLIAAWLAYQYFSELGPQIRIVFPNSEGLNPGQSQIKYRDVSIGTVKKIILQKEGKGVVVIAKMEKSAVPFLNENTKFWIVKPEVGISGISGLDTLISGTYIGMVSSEGEESKRSFIGLAQAYKFSREGVYFQLSAPSGYNVKEGTPLYFKGTKAGQVEYLNISLDGQNIDFAVFVNKPYVPYVHSDSKFWVTSAVDIDFANGRLDVNVAPVTYLMQGGIEFSSTGEDPSDTVPEQFIFELHKNGNLAVSQNVGRGGNFIKSFEMMTEDSIAKLKIGAPVEYEGYEVGWVKNVELSYNDKTHKILGKVLLAIDVSSFASEDDNVTNCQNKFHKAIEEGLSAKISPTDPITGMLYVDLLFDSNSTHRTVTKGQKYALLPSIKNDGGGMMDEADKLLKKINSLPLEKLLASINKVVDDSAEPINTVLTDLQKTVKDMNALTGKKSFQTMPNEVDKTLKELSKTLATAQKTMKGYDNQSLLARQISEALKVVTETSKSMQQFLEMLNRKPDSLIFGDQ